jgi:hypothetical protein
MNNTIHWTYDDLLCGFLSENHRYKCFSRFYIVPEEDGRFSLHDNKLMHSNTDCIAKGTLESCKSFAGTILQRESELVTQEVIS